MSKSLLLCSFFGGYLTDKIWLYALRQLGLLHIVACTMMPLLPR